MPQPRDAPRQDRQRDEECEPTTKTGPAADQKRDPLLQKPGNEKYKGEFILTVNTGKAYRESALVNQGKLCKYISSTNLHSSVDDILRHPGCNYLNHGDLWSSDLRHEEKPSEEKGVINFSLEKMR